MAIERIVDTSLDDDSSEEQVIEITLRPQNFEEYIGQERLKKNLKLAIEAALKTWRTDRPRLTLGHQGAW